MECSVGNGLGGTEGKWKKQLTRLGLVRCKEVFKEQWGLWGGNTKCRLEVSPKSDVRITAADVCDGVSSCLKRMLLSHRQSHSTSEWLHYRHSEKYHQDIAAFADKKVFHTTMDEWKLTVGMVEQPCRESKAYWIDNSLATQQSSFERDNDWQNEGLMTWSWNTSRRRL